MTGIIKNRYLLGILIVFTGGAFLSTSGILLRNLEHADGWQVALFRSLAFFITIATILCFRYRRNTFPVCRAVGVKGILAATLLGLGSVCYIFAMLNTTVANVVFIIGSAPLVTALMGWLFLKEKVGAWSLVAMFTAVIGIGLMFLDGLLGGGLFGNLLALLLVFMFASYLLLVRSNKHIDMVPATALSGLVTFAVAAVMVGDIDISLHDLVICVMLGSFQLGLGFLFLTVGTRFLPAAEVALFSLSESILNPLWVWIGVNEIPGSYTLWGSAIVLLSVIAYSLIAIRNERKLTTAAS